MMVKTTGVATGLAGERQAGTMGEAQVAPSERWATLLAQWRASGQSGRAFCRERGLVYSQWLYWRERQAGGAGQSAPAPAAARREAPQSAQAGDFVALAPDRAVNGKRRRPVPARGAGTPGASAGCGLRLRLGGSLELVLDRGFDEGELRRVLRVLVPSC